MFFLLFGHIKKTEGVTCIRIRDLSQYCTILLPAITYGVLARKELIKNDLWNFYKKKWEDGFLKFLDHCLVEFFFKKNHCLVDV